MRAQRRWLPITGTAQFGLVAVAQVPANSTSDQNYTVPGLRPGAVILPLMNTTVGIVLAMTLLRVATADTLTIRFANPAAVAKGPGSVAFYLVDLSPLAIGEVVLDPASVTNGQARNQSFTVPGLRPGDLLLPVPPNNLTAGVISMPMRVATADTLTIRFANVTGAPVDPASGTWVLVNLGGLPASLLTLDPAVIAAATTANQSIAVPGLAGDRILAIPPTTLTDDVIYTPRAVVAANNLLFRALNPSAGGVDPAADTWAVVDLAGAV